MISTKMRFLLYAEIRPFCLPNSNLTWPNEIPITDGPFAVPRPKHWNLTHEEDRYIQFQGVLANGNHEWIYIPFSHRREVRIYQLETTLTSSPIDIDA